MRFALWLSVVAPSIFIAHRLAGWPGVAAHAVVSAVAVPALLGVPQRVSPRTARWLALLTAVAVVIIFAVGYRTFDVDLPDRGSDDDEAHEVGAWALLKGENPYTQQTYLGNSVSPMPGALLLAAPFVVAGMVAVQNLFWLVMFFLAARKESGDSRRALALSWIAIGLCLPVLHNVVTGTSHVANAIYVALGLAWLTRAQGSVAASVFWGVTLASRANFVFLAPCAIVWLWRRASPAAALRSATWTLATVALLILPFYLADPAAFAPLHTASKIRRFDAFIPHASLAVAVMTGALAIVVGARAASRAALFAGGALVQALPVLAVLVLSYTSDRPYLAASTYGEFAMWLVVMSVAISAGVASESLSTMSSRRWRDSVPPGVGSASS